jgi:PAS domain S-box-containing protein
MFMPEIHIKVSFRFDDHLESIRIVAIYALFGILWICLSDTVVGWLIHDPAALTRLSVYKGILFIVLTSALLYFLISRYLSRVAEYDLRLLKSEERFTSVFDNMSDALFIHDAVAGVIIDANESATRMFGYDREEIARLRVGDISQGAPPYSQVEALQWLRRVADGSIPVTYEWRCRRKDGSLFWAECTMCKAPIGGDNFIVVAVRDSSERKRMETLLRESEEHFRTLAENSPDIIMRYDRECRRVYVNPSYSRATGIFAGKSETGVLGDSWLDSMSMTEDDYWSRLRQVMESGVSTEMLLEWKSRDTGRVTSHILNVVAERDSEGNIVGCLAIGHNISGRREVEFKLARLAESSPGVMYTFLLRPDGGSCMPYVSVRMEALCGLRPEDVVEDMSQVYARIHADDICRVQKSIAQSARTLTPWHAEFRMRHPAKGDVWVEGRSTPEPRPDGAVLWSGFFHDITERKVAEASLDAKQKQLASMAVDLSLAEERERRRIASELHDHIGQMLLLIRIKLGSLAAQFEESVDGDTYRDIQELLGQTITDVRSLTQQLNPPLLSCVGLEAALEWLAKRMEKDYSLLVDFSDDGSAKPLCGEFRAVLFQSARELLINVSKYAGTNEAWLTIGREADRLRLVVQDGGIGFLCHPHNGMHGLRNSSYGLFNIRQRIEYLGGKLVIESAPGCGTRVTIHVPLTIDEVEGSISAPYLIESGVHAKTEGR